MTLFKIAPLDPVGLISLIFDLADRLQRVVQRVKANKKDCAHLSGRVNNIVGFLKSADISAFNEPIINALHRFAEFLRQCEAFVRKFSDSNSATRFVHNRSNAEHFRRLNQELTDHRADLKFGLQLPTTLNPLVPGTANIAAQEDKKRIKETHAKVRKSKYFYKNDNEN
jgi:hypothetical protein